MVCEGALAKQSRNINAAKVLEETQWEDHVSENWFRRASYRRAEHLYEVCLDMSVPLPPVMAETSLALKDIATKWATSMRLNVAETCKLQSRIWKVGLTQFDREKPTCEERAFADEVASLPFDVLVTDDKNHKKAWGCSFETLRELAAEVAMSRVPAWSPAPFSRKSVGEFVHGAFATALPAFLKKGPRKKEWRLPTASVQIKGKCFASGLGRTCLDQNHSCLRKVVNWSVAPFAKGWRAIGRAITCMIRRVPGSREVWSLADVPSAIEDRVRSLQPPSSCCQRPGCNAPKPELVMYAADAPQMFEQITPRQVLFAQVFWSSEYIRATGAAHIACNTRGKPKWHSNIAWQGAVKPGWVSLSLAQLRYALWISAGCVWVAFGNAVLQSGGLLIGGYLAKVCTSLVLGAAEAKSEVDDSEVAILRYVDDLLLVSSVFCYECLEVTVKNIYPIQFLEVPPKADGFVWTDLVLHVSGRRVVYEPKAPNRDWLTGSGPRAKFSAPPWLGRQQVSFARLRARFVGLIARLQQLKIEQSHKVSCVCDLIFELVLLGYPSDFLRALVFSFSGSISANDGSLVWLVGIRVAVNVWSKQRRKSSPSPVLHMAKRDGDRRGGDRRGGSNRGGSNRGGARGGRASTRKRSSSSTSSSAKRDTRPARDRSTSPGYGEYKRQQREKKSEEKHRKRSTMLAETLAAVYGPKAASPSLPPQSLSGSPASSSLRPSGSPGPAGHHAWSSPSFGQSWAPPPAWDWHQVDGSQPVLGAAFPHGFPPPPAMPPPVFPPASVAAPISQQPVAPPTPQQPDTDFLQLLEKTLRRGLPGAASRPTPDLPSVEQQINDMLERYSQAQPGHDSTHSADAINKLLDVVSKFPEHVANIQRATSAQAAPAQAASPVAASPPPASQASTAAHRIHSPAGPPAPFTFTVAQLRWIEAELDHTVVFGTVPLSAKEVEKKMVDSEELKAKQARDRISKFINRFQTETAKAIPPKLPDRIRRFVAVAAAAPM